MLISRASRWGDALSSNHRGGPIFYSYQTAGGGACQTCYLHHGLDGGAWSSNTGGNSNYPRSFPAIGPLLAQLPNAWNSETVLLPFPVLPAAHGWATRSRWWRTCGICATAVSTITIRATSSRWALTTGSSIPGTGRDATNRNGTNGSEATHSGTFGFAVRYDGSV